MKKTINAIYSKDQMLLQNIPLFEFNNFSVGEKSKTLKPNLINKRISQKLKEFKNMNNKKRSASKKSKNKTKKKNQTFYWKNRQKNG